MKILVAYYSLYGHTGKVGERIAKLLNADVEAIKDTKNLSHLISWGVGAFDEELKKPTQIEKTKNQVREYDLVVIGTPIWDGITPPIKAYLMQNNFKKVAFFITSGAAAEDAAYLMSKLSKKKPVAVLEIQDRQVDNKEDKDLINEFCRKIKKKA